jgi:hypothetical protein
MTSARWRSMLRHYKEAEWREISPVAAADCVEE